VAWQSCVWAQTSQLTPTSRPNNQPHDISKHHIEGMFLCLTRTIRVWMMEKASDCTHCAARSAAFSPESQQGPGAQPAVARRAHSIHDTHLQRCLHHTATLACALQATIMRHTPITDIPHPNLPGHPFRQWVCPLQPPATTAPPALQLRIMSYNVLSETIRNQTAYLYKNVHDPICRWRHRMGLILAEVKHYGADVVSMQEVQEDSALPQRMWQLGYAHSFVGRTGGKPDGCALFWCALAGGSSPPANSTFVGPEFQMSHSTGSTMCGLTAQNVSLASDRLIVALHASPPPRLLSRTNRAASIMWLCGHIITAYCSQLPHLFRKRSKFQCVGQEGIQMCSHNLNDNAAQVVALRPLYSKTPLPDVIVGNIHVLFNNKRGDTKLGQVHCQL
jgi:hypothetical protein